MKRFLKVTAIIFLLLTAINAVVAGTLFIIDPTGKKMGMTVAYLQHSPFHSFLIPGIVLFLVNGLLNCIAAYVTIKNKPSAPVFIIIQGILLCGWIVIQVLLVKDIGPLHIIMFSIGLVLVVCGFQLQKMRHNI